MTTVIAIKMKKKKLLLIVMMSPSHCIANKKNSHTHIKKKVQLRILLWKNYI